MTSKLILGTVQMGLNYGINNSTGQISFEECCNILDYAFKSNILTLDTAEAYGNAHKVIGDYHRLNHNKRFNIITKIPNIEEYINIENKLKEYLDHLHVENLEVLMFHSFDTYKKRFNSLDILLKLRQQGYFNYLGVSVYTNEQIEELLDDNRIDVVQLPFNVLDNDTIRGELLQKLKLKNKIVHTRSAFLQGLFFKDNSTLNTVYRALSNEMNILNDIVEEENTSITNLALNYCLVQEYIDNVLIGVDSVKQLQDNLMGLDYEISENALNKINEIKVENKDLLNPALWK